MEARRLGVGASEIAVLFGLSPWQTIRELWHEVHGCSYEAGSELFHWGHTMEDIIGEEFERRTGEKVSKPHEMIIVGEKPYYRASLDRVIVEDGEEVAALELKNLNEGRYQEYKVAGPSVGPASAPVPNDVCWSGVRLPRCAFRWSALWLLACRCFSIGSTRDRLTSR